MFVLCPLLQAPAICSERRRAYAQVPVRKQCFGLCEVFAAPSARSLTYIVNGLLAEPAASIELRLPEHHCLLLRLFVVVVLELVLEAVLLFQPLAEH